MRLDVRSAAVTGAMERSFYLLDVFAEGHYTGNQLAVFRNAALLGDDDMRRLAREVHFSETAFVLSDDIRHGGYDVRVFTPTEEIPFSGHAVLGAAWVLQRELICEPVDSITVNLGVGPVAVKFAYQYGQVDTVWVNHCPPRFGTILPVEHIAAAVNLEPADIDTRWPVQEVSTGLTFIMVPVRSLAAIRRACVVPTELACITEFTSARALYLFTQETYDTDNDFNTRMFAPQYGIAEDPATGAGAGCLVAYALQHIGSSLDGLDLRIEQGYEMRRPSILLARGRLEDGAVRVTVGGRVTLVAQGQFV